MTTSNLSGHGKARPGVRVLVEGRVVPGLDAVSWRALMLTGGELRRSGNGDAGGSQACARLRSLHQLWAEVGARLDVATVNAASDGDTGRSAPSGGEPRSDVDVEVPQRPSWPEQPQRGKASPWGWVNGIWGRSGAWRPRRCERGQPAPPSSARVRKL